MSKLFALLLLIVFFNCSQKKPQSKKDYLENNRYDLNSEGFKFPETNFNILGFAAYHGSAKTEHAEIALLKSLTKENRIRYYLPETDYSTAHYLNKFLKTGDTLLLKDLILFSTGKTVGQERSIETFNKWIKLKQLNDKLSDKEKLTVVGVDIIYSLKYIIKHLNEILDNSSETEKSIKKINDIEESNIWENKVIVPALKDFILYYDENMSNFNLSEEKKFNLNHIIKNLKIVFGDFDRDQSILDNYLALKFKYKFDFKPQFMKIGFSHIEKEKDGGYSYFFNRLIENGIYNRDSIISVMGYLTDSKVLWDHEYDDNNNYISYTTEGNLGIGDDKTEYFLGIQNLKDTKISDMTLYKLNQENTPYNDSIPDLIEVVTTNKDMDNSESVKGKSTTDFIDYAILISDSKANTPIEEKDK